ncbi:MAG TPA: hypothetical protein VG347_20280 [Verrucomicrobiae bacterium]|nr:hypothetical protein [Verrucomicrobiae bacterium]
MKKARETLTEVAVVSFAGFILLGIVFLAPNGSGDPASAFFRTASGTEWRHWLDWPAAWCSVKLILLSASLFLLIDSFRTLLLVLNRRRLAGKVFVFIALPFMGFFVGGYYLVKSLL